MLRKEKKAGASLGARIRYLRQQLGLSQTTLARRVGSGRYVTVSEWENDHKEPDKGTLFLIASLTAEPEKTYLWLVNEGERPPIMPRSLDAKSAVAPLNSLFATVPPLPPLPLLEQDSDAQRQAYLTFMERVVALAYDGKFIRAHHLLEWATMLLRSSDMLSLVTKRLNLLLRELPILVLELDADERVIGSHAGKLNNDGDDPTLDAMLMRRHLSEILPQIDPKELREAILNARNGNDTEVPYTIPFMDGDRSYIAHLYILADDQHMMLFVKRATDTRSDELGLRKRVGL